MHMQTQDMPVQERQPRSRRDKITIGVMLVGLGALFLATQFINLDLWFLPIISIIFLITGVMTRQAGWIIPGGIVGGIGLGVLAIEGPYQFVAENAESGLFLMAFAVGWVLVYLFSKFFTPHPQSWALIPGGIMALIGLAAIGIEAAANVLGWVGSVFDSFNDFWPIALVVVGLYVLFSRDK